MRFIQRYNSPLGAMLLAADEVGLVGAWFEGQKYFAAGLSNSTELPSEPMEGASHALTEATRWLDVYFTGEVPDFLPPLHLVGSAFRQAVWTKLLQIPYGETTTYGAIAKQIAAQREGARVSARAVGGAVGHNPISVIVPCHRVVGADDSLTGYAGGIERKVRLLELEGTNTCGLFVPTRG